MIGLYTEKDSWYNKTDARFLKCGLGDNDMNEVQCREYLKRIGYTGEIAHTPQCLDELILAHLAAIPFENLDACEDHLVPSLDEHVLFEKIIRHKRGGWCFELNKLFFELLKGCGFQVMPVAVRITWMKEEPAALLHRATVVTLENRPYLCDVGYGGPGPKGVTPLTDGEYEIQGEGYQIVTGQGETGDMVILKKRYHGEYHEMMRFQNQRAEDADYAIMNFFCARSDDSFFASKPVINLYTKEGNRSLIDHTLSLQRQGEKVTEECHSEEEKKEWLKKYFGIEK